jgi:hypothetical protein
LSSVGFSAGCGIEFFYSLSEVNAAIAELLTLSTRCVRSGSLA